MWSQHRLLTPGLGDGTDWISNQIREPCTDLPVWNWPETLHFPWVRWQPSHLSHYQPGPEREGWLRNKFCCGACSAGPRPSPGRRRDTVGFSGLTQAKHIPVGDTLWPARQWAQTTSISLKMISPIHCRLPVVRLGMKLCLSSLISTLQKLTWKQYNSFRPAKGTEAFVG